MLKYYAINTLKVCDKLTVALPAMRHWGICLPRLTAISFLVHFGVNLTANYPNIV